MSDPPHPASILPQYGSKNCSMLPGHRNHAESATFTATFVLAVRSQHTKKSTALHTALHALNRPMRLQHSIKNQQKLAAHAAHIETDQSSLNGCPRRMLVMRPPSLPYNLRNP